MEKIFKKIDEKKLKTGYSGHVRICRIGGDIEFYHEARVVEVVRPSSLESGDKIIQGFKSEAMARFPRLVITV